MPYVPKGAVPVQTGYVPKGAAPIQISPEDNYSPVQKAVTSVADALPTVGGVMGGMAGRVLPGSPSVNSAVGTTAGTGAALPIKWLARTLAGTENRSQDEITKESIEAPLAAGATDLAVSGAINTVKPVIKGIGSFINPYKSAVDLFESIFTLPRTVAEKIGISKVAPTLLEDGMGGKSLDEMVQVADKVAGKNGIINAAAREVSNAHGASIGIDNAMTAAENIAEQERAFLGGGAASAAKQDAIVQNVQGNIRRTILGNSPTGIGKISAIDAYDAAKKLENIAYSYQAGAERSSVQGTQQLQMKALSRIYKAAAQELIDSIDELPESKAVLEGLKNADTKAALEEISPKLWKRFQAATSFKELRNIMSPYVKVSQAAQQTMAQANTPITKLLGNASAGNLFGLTNLVTGAIQSPEASGSIAGGLYNAGKAGNVASPVMNFLGSAAPTTIRAGAQVGANQLQR